MISLLEIFAGHGLKFAAVVGLTATLATCDYKRIKQAETVGALKERASVEKKSNENAAKANAARRDAERVPANRLCDRYSRDC